MDTKDPLLLATPDAARALFTKFSKEANGFNIEAVFGASINMLVNGVRQTHNNRDEARKSLEYLSAKAMEVLMQHYDSTGRKRGIFPYDQVIHVDFANLRSRSGS